MMVGTEVDIWEKGAGVGHVTEILPDGAVRVEMEPDIGGLVRVYEIRYMGRVPVGTA